MHTFPMNQNWYEIECALRGEPSVRRIGAPLELSHDLACSESAAFQLDGCHVGPVVVRADENVIATRPIGQTKRFAIKVDYDTISRNALHGNRATFLATTPRVAALIDAAGDRSHRPAHSMLSCKRLKIVAPSLYSASLTAS